MLPNSQPESAGLQPQQRFKYLVCRHGRNITIKRSDRNHDFGTVLCECDTYAKAIGESIKFSSNQLKHNAKSEALT